MSTVLSLSVRPSADHIDFIDAFVSFDDSAGTMHLSTEGRAYYEGWFRRFGFRLDDNDVDGFVKTVMLINRESGQLEQGRLRALIDGGTLSAEEAALWELYLAGEFEAFAEGLEKLANKVDAVADNVVQLFRRRPAAT